MRQKKFCHYCGNRLIDKHIEGRVRRYCNKCLEPMYENPVPATCVVVADKHNNIWLVKRSVEPKVGYWCLPGGFMELGETPEQAALRELKEETNITGKIEMLLGISANPSPTYRTVLMGGYLVRNFSGDPMAGDDASDIGCFGPDDLPEIAFESHRQFIRIFYSAYAVDLK
ncbi:MAG: NUDIX hydrolase [Deltaproteobacteria bacterium]|nr:NUDIX hydrolase [Deltaproteobacteria bacterium]